MAAQRDQKCEEDSLGSHGSYSQTHGSWVPDLACDLEILATGNVYIKTWCLIDWATRRLWTWLLKCFVYSLRNFAIIFIYYGHPSKAPLPSPVPVSVPKAERRLCRVLFEKKIDFFRLVLCITTFPFWRCILKTLVCILLVSKMKSIIAYKLNFTSYITLA